MLKRLMTTAACLLLGSMALVSAPAHAAGNWMFINYCYVMAFCPGGPDPVTFQYMSSEAHCYAVRDAVNASWPYNSWMRISTMCWEE